MEKMKIIDIDKADELVKKARFWGENLSDAGLKTHQLRRIYDTVQGIYSQSDGKRLTQEQKDKLQFLKPLLAYVSSKKDNLKSLHEQLNPLIDEIGDDYRKLNNFYRFLQSILAYHKYYEEEKKQKEGKQ